ncbi:WxL domain-containing protein [Carnobacterium divergens]|uniref:WxL domain-containing protein n=1 Tax=Carnobacterium divergens TaxID=2748 RepID=A0AAW8R9S5_CARDV|nr:WxL domain-containing protein [Carnobacterium divergens]MDT1957108.1 WxL domain-containing protein [Carnobacterium divergens]MDT1973078.1 WxL domain-containing protein [Carnobacterium divergens]
MFNKWKKIGGLIVTTLLVVSILVGSIGELPHVFADNQQLSLTAETLECTEDSLLDFQVEWKELTNSTIVVTLPLDFQFNVTEWENKNKDTIKNVQFNQEKGELSFNPIETTGKLSVEVLAGAEGSKTISAKVNELIAEPLIILISKNKDTINSVDRPVEEQPNTEYEESETVDNNGEPLSIENDAPTASSPEANPEIPSVNTSDFAAVDSGWKELSDLKTHKTFALPFNRTAYYGFNTRNVFNSDIFLKDETGKEIAYLFGKDKSQKFYISEMKTSLFPIYHDYLEYTNIDGIEITKLAEQEENGVTKLRAYGMIKSSSLLGKQNEFEVRVTLTPNLDTGDIIKQIDIKRVRSTGGLSPSPYDKKIGFVELNDTKLNGEDDVDVKYIGRNQGMYIESNPYKIMFKFNQSNMGEPPTNWNAAKWLGVGITGIHYATPEDFFSGWKEAKGVENKNGQPGEVIKHLSDSSVGFKWPISEMKKDQNRLMTYTINLGEPIPPKLTIKNKNERLKKDETKTLQGTWSDADSKYVNLYYSVDGGESKPIQENIANPDKGKEYQWQQKISAKELGIGLHRINVFAMDDQGNSSAIAEAQWRVLDQTEYIFEKTYTKSGDPNKTKVGDKVHYLIYLENTSGIYYDITYLSDQLPLVSEGLTVLSDSIVGTTADGEKEKDQILYDEESGTIYFAGQNVESGANIQLEFDAVVNSNAIGKETLINRAGTAVKTKASPDVLQEITTEVSLPGSKIEENPVPKVTETYENLSKNEEINHVGDELLYQLEIKNDAKISQMKTDVNWYTIEAYDMLPAGLDYQKDSLRIIDEEDNDVTSQLNQDKSNITGGIVESMLDLKIATLEPQKSYTVQFKAKIKPDQIGKEIINYFYAKGTNINGDPVEDEAKLTVDNIEESLEPPILKIEHMPSFDFGSLKLPKKAQLIERKNTDFITIKDTRGVGSSWKLTAQLTEKLTNGNQTMNGLIYVNDAGTKQILELGTSTLIAEGTTKDDPIQPLAWNASNGLLLTIDSSAYLGKYKGSIEWTLENVP